MMIAATTLPKPRGHMAAIYDLASDPGDVAAGFGPAYPEPFDLELAYTEQMRASWHLPPAERELAALESLFPAMLQPIGEADCFAGRIKPPLAGFWPELVGLGYCCHAEDIRNLARTFGIGGEKRARIASMLDFWRGKTTREKVRAAYPRDVEELLASDNWTTEPGIAFPLYRLGGTNLDYAKLLRLGIGGLRAEIREKTLPKNPALAAGLERALDLYARCLRHYADQAEVLVAHGGGTDDEPRLARIASSCRAAAGGGPADSFHGAIQMAWVYALISGTWNYGRADVWAGPYLAADLDAGCLSEEGATAWLCSWWRLMKAYENHYNNRVFIGGRGRPDERAADRFALLAIEATRRVRLNQPQLSLRFYEGQNPELMRRALDAIGDGCTFPMLYNDDANIPAVAAAFALPEGEAVHYMPFGCGEYTLEHRGIASPNAVINLLQALVATIGGGIDPPTGTPAGIPTKSAGGYASFDDLWAEYARVVEAHVAATAKQQKIEYDIAAAEAPFLFLTLLQDDCIARGQAVLEGGSRYLGATLETYGNTNAADALTAIRSLVFEERRYSLAEVAAGCARNFAGAETLRRDLLGAPKYGNDDPDADAMAARVHDHVCRATRVQAARAGLDFYLVVIINNWANTVLGAHTGASPDGRLAGQPMANANNPAPGNDRQGATAFLNSLVKLDPAIHAGAVQNMKFSRELFSRERPKLEALLAGYWSAGGTQAMITVVSRADLESAMREPDQWGHLMVRVGGFSIRFVDLPRAAQHEILGRTLHE